MKKHVALTALLLLLTVSPLSAQDEERMTLLVDAETESYFRHIAEPLLKHMDLHSEEIRYHIVLSDQINAFVASARDVYFMTGLINKADNPDEVLGVLAHELGHMQGRHLFRAAVMQDEYKIPAILAGVLGAGAVIAGAPQAGGAILVGAQAAGVSNLLRFTRSQEQQADQIGLDTLLAAGYTPIGMESFFKKLRTDEVLYTKTPPSYLLTHPSPAQRQDFLANAVQQAEGKNLTHLPQAPFDRIKAKLYALSETPARVLRKYQHDKSFAGRYAVAIANARLAKFDDAMQDVNALMKEQPDDPYLYELKGQILQDIGSLDEALPLLEKALSYEPDMPLLRFEVGELLLQQDKVDEALPILQTVRNSMPDWARLHYLLGVAYGKKGLLSLSHLSLAESSLLQGLRDDAKYHVQLAEHYLDKKDTAAAEKLALMKEALESEKN
ncbi:MAG: M48 family metalloprotease [Proteobacteria bacterium]|nr:M48 family metalloprotease [Pseudomonadota bacterium]